MKAILAAAVLAVSFVGCVHVQTPEEIEAEQAARAQRKADWDALTPAQRQEIRERRQAASRAEQLRQQRQAMEHIMSAPGLGHSNKAKCTSHREYNGDVTTECEQ